MLIIPSGKPKLWDKKPDAGAILASEAYIGTFHRLCRGYADMLGEAYLILSPKYGFLHPTDEVAKSYDVRFTYQGVTTETISLEKLRNQWETLAIKKPSITVLGGKKFQPLLKKVAPDQHFTFPLIGSKGIGEMQQRLKAAIAARRPL